MTLHLIAKVVLLLMWTAAFIERIDALCKGAREASLWSLAFVSAMLCLQCLAS